MRSNNYRQYFTAENMMGPNSIRILDELLENCPLYFTADQTILDLGCGTGLTSLFAARETGATVYANDLWISAEANAERFAAWQMQGRLIPVHEDANDLHFDREMFDAIISVDSYHYFGGRKGFFAEKLLPFLKPGGVALIAVPGMRNAYDGRSEALCTAWLTDEAYMFQSARWWKKTIGTHEDMAECSTWEMAAFDQPWQEWFDTRHKYALNDQTFYESVIRPYTCFVGMMIRKK
ncbi:MAG: class I SAM-dependent methyltransferase [Clostridia bacterium]|nr:class I SAM-dependent methyltransferase [Clostridia bacterium]